MKIRPELSERQEELSREKDNDKGISEVEAASEIQGQRGNHARGGSGVSHDIHDRCGVELHDEDAHRRAAEFFRLLIHLMCFQIIGSIYFQCCKALNAFEKYVAEVGIRCPVLSEYSLRDLLDNDNGKGNQRNKHEKDQGRADTDQNRHHQKQGCGGKKTVGQL